MRNHTDDDACGSDSGSTYPTSEGTNEIKRERKSEKEERERERQRENVPI